MRSTEFCLGVSDSRVWLFFLACEMGLITPDVNFLCLSSLSFQVMLSVQNLLKRAIPMIKDFGYFKNSVKGKGNSK